MSKRKSKGFLNFRIFALVFLFLFSASMAMGQTPLLKPVYINLGDIANVSPTVNSPTDNYVLTYDAATKLWGPEPMGAHCYEAVTTATPSEAFTVDWTANKNHQVTITGVALDITFTNPSGPCRLTLKIIQGDGDDTIDWTNEADLKFPGGVDPVLSTGSGDVDFLSIWWDGSEYIGIMNYDFD